MSAAASTRKPRQVGLLLVDVVDLGTGDDPHFRAELVDESYEKLGLRPFTGPGHVGGYTHLYGEGTSREEALSDLAKTVSDRNLTGTLRVQP